MGNGYRHKTSEEAGLLHEHLEQWICYELVYGRNTLFLTTIDNTVIAQQSI
jgi:hypothetical protein